MKLLTIDELTIEQKAGELLMVGFMNNYYDEVLDEYIKKYHINNFVLYERNIQDLTTFYALCKRIHDECIIANGMIPFIAIEVNESILKKLFGEDSYPPSLSQGFSKNYDSSFIDGKFISSSLIKLGINVLIKPRIVINKNEKAQAKYYSKYLNGLNEFGVLGCLKSFPGESSSNASWHHLKKHELYPFSKNINIPSIMVSHTLLPKFDSICSSLSHVFLDYILRRYYKYQGVIFTDCLEKSAVRNYYPCYLSATMAITFGADVALISTTYEEVIKAIKKMQINLIGEMIDSDLLNQKLRRLLDAKMKSLPSLKKYFYDM